MQQYRDHFEELGMVIAVASVCVCDWFALTRLTNMGLRLVWAWALHAQNMADTQFLSMGRR